MADSITTWRASVSAHEIAGAAPSSGGGFEFQIVAVHHTPWAKRPPRPTPMKLEVAYTPESVPLGGVIHARATVKWEGPAPAPMPVVEIGIPPGFEPETGDLEALVERRSILRYEVSSARATLYLAGLDRADPPAGFAVRLRGKVIARVLVPASAAYPYYEPEARAETAPVAIRATSP